MPYQLRLVNLALTVVGWRFGEFLFWAWTRCIVAARQIALLLILVFSSGSDTTPLLCDYAQGLCGGLIPVLLSHSNVIMIEVDICRFSIRIMYNAR